MNTRCKACGKPLKLSEKVLESLKTLEAGKSIRVKCPQCSQILAFDQSILGNGTSKPQPTPEPQGGFSDTALPETDSIASIFSSSQDDLLTDELEEQLLFDDLPLALVLMRGQESREHVIRTIESLGYRAVFAEDAQGAIQKLLFTDFVAVVYHENFEENGLENSVFHQYMSKMAMSKRRYIFYALLGNSFKSMNNLQALSYSANIVINEKDLQHLSKIFRKAISEYEKIFGQMIEDLRKHGK